MKKTTYRIRRFAPAVSLTLLLLFAGCAAADGQDQTQAAEPASGDSVIEMKVLQRGSYGKMAEDADAPARRAPFLELARDRASLDDLWNRYIGGDGAPSVSFERSIVVFLLMPPQPTGGYGIEPHGVSISEGTIEIDATLHQPGPKDIVTQAFTAPFAVIEVEGVTEAEKVVWINQSRPLATKMIDR